MNGDSFASFVAAGAMGDDYGVPDGDDEIVRPPADSPRILNSRDRIEACEQRFAREVRGLRAYLAGALHPSPRALEHVESVLLPAVERAANTLAVESGKFGWLRRSELAGDDRTAALVAWETRDREAGAR